MNGRCPVCVRPMIALELDGVEVDHCPHCAGTWLDAGELELIAERAGAGAAFRIETDPRASRRTGRARRCPRCPRRLDARRIWEVEIDLCPGGHGIWLDAGELETLVTRAAGPAARAVADWLSDLYRNQREA